jgi:sulfate adenylyltransferase
VPAEVRMRAYQAVLGYFPAGRVLLVAPMRYAGPREAVVHALVRKNYGCTQPGWATTTAPTRPRSCSPPWARRSWGSRRCGSTTPSTAGAVGRWPPARPAQEHLELSGTQVRAMLAAGQLPPAESSRPEVARLLIDAYQS